MSLPVVSMTSPAIWTLLSSPFVTAPLPSNAPPPAVWAGQIGFEVDESAEGQSPLSATFLQVFGPGNPLSCLRQCEDDGVAVNRWLGGGRVTSSRVGLGE